MGTQVQMGITACRRRPRQQSVSWDYTAENGYSIPTYIEGFKDHDRADIDRYAGTSSRCSQKLLVSEAVARKWDTATTDISKAFLQGVT